LQTAGKNGFIDGGGGLVREFIMPGQAVFFRVES